MNELYELKDKLMNELAEYAQHGKFSREDVETVKYIASAIDHICNICEDDYSVSNRSSYGRNGAGSYRGSYARGRGQYARRDSMGRYSRAGDMADQLESMMKDAPNEEIKQQIRDLINQIERV